RGLALLLDDRLDEAFAWSARHLDESRSAPAGDALHGHAFVVSVVLLLRGRTAELHEHLGSVLSTGLLSALQRPFQSAILSLAEQSRSSRAARRRRARSPSSRGTSVRGRARCRSRSRR